MKYLYLCFISLFTSVAHAAGVINFLELENDVVLFSTAEDKTSYPACVNNDQTQLWSLSLSTDMGRAAYSLILTSMAKGDIALSIESAQDCGVLDGVERAQKITLVNSASSQSSGTKVGVYTSDDIRLGTLLEVINYNTGYYVNENGVLTSVNWNVGTQGAGLYYIEENCAGAAYTLNSSGALSYHPDINDGYFFASSRANRQSLSIRSVMSTNSDGSLKCTNHSSLKNVYPVDFEVQHMICGRKNCYLKEE